MGGKVRGCLNFLRLVVAGSAMIGCSRDSAMLRIHYVPIGIETFTPVTADNVEERGAMCVVNAPSDVAEIKRIITSATPAVRDEEIFTDMAVRVKIMEKSSETGERLVAIVENHGPVRIGSTNRVLSGNGLADLKKLIERACKFSS